MFQNRLEPEPSSFRHFAFSEKVWRCLKRAERSKNGLKPTDRSIIVERLNEVRAQINIADEVAICSILDKNPFAIQVSSEAEGGTKGGLLAILPLNESGFSAVTQGVFSGLHPEPEWISSPGEQPTALYIWLVIMPGNFGRLLSAIGNAIDPIATRPCPMFSRSVTPHSARLHKGAGFMAARNYFPDADSDLLVVFPQQKLPEPKRPVLDVQVARSIEDIFKVFSVRSATYIAEQFCFYDEEFDGNDFCSTHFLGRVDGDAAGCVRLRFFNGFAKLERLAVRAEYRQSRLAYQLVRAALDHAARKGYRRVLGHSRLDLVRFWRVFGFRPIETRPEFSFAGVRYQEIMAELAPHAEPIPETAQPLVILRPEGAWDKPGPFDHNLSAQDPRRQKLLEERTRTIKGLSVASA
jgi:predicted GNAT family N-acyltransferase